MPTQRQIENKNAWLEWRLREEQNPRGDGPDAFAKRLKSRWYRMKRHIQQQEMRAAKIANRYHANVVRNQRTAQGLLHQQADQGQLLVNQQGTNFLQATALDDAVQQAAQQHLRNRLQRLQGDNDQLQNQNLQLESRNVQLQDHNEQLRASLQNQDDVEEDGSDEGDPIKDVEGERELHSVDSADEFQQRHKSFALNYPPVFGGSNWEPGWEVNSSAELGASTFGVARLYLRRDENEEIIDRIVVKDVFMDPTSWTAFHKWHGPPSDRMPREAHCMLALKGRPGSEFCVNIRGRPKAVLKERRYRLYMDYCPHKSLYTILLGEKDDVTGKPRALHSKDPIPEPALWSILNNLVDACLLLQYGDANGTVVAPDWKPIVHRDFKLDNIWLAEPISGGEFPSYPRAVLGDFGLAVMTDESDPLNPVGYNDDGGVEGWRAPEQNIWVNEGTNRPVFHPNLNNIRLGEHTNVWGIGAIMVRLMNQEAHLEAINFEDKEDRDLMVDITMRQNYSSDLLAVVEKCTRFDPSHRYSLVDLKRDIVSRTTPGSASQDLAQGLRTNDIDDSNRDLRLRISYDRSKIKLARWMNR